MGDITKHIHEMIEEAGGYEAYMKSLETEDGRTNSEKDVFLKFRAKSKNGEYRYGLPHLIYSENGGKNSEERWYMYAHEICICERTNSFYEAGEEYKSKYGYKIEKDTIEVSLNNNDYVKCSFIELLTKNYTPVK